MTMNGTQALRVFYRKQDGEIVWTHELRGPGKFPTTIKDDIDELPGKIVSLTLSDNGDITGKIELGGAPGDYSCVVIADKRKAESFLLSDSNRIAGGEVIIGAPRQEVIK